MYGVALLDKSPICKGRSSMACNCTLTTWGAGVNASTLTVSSTPF